MLAGAALAGLPLAELPLALLAASACLYSGGMALNDFADRRRDAVQRPERLIPSGKLSAGAAGAAGFGLLAGGVGLAAAAGGPSAVVAGGVALAVLVYDFLLKHSRVAGPLGMALCRGGNLLLGGSLLLPAARPELLVGVGGLAAYVACLTGASLAEDADLPRWLRGLFLTGMLACLSAPFWLGPRSPLGLAALLPAAAVLLYRWRDLTGPAPGLFVKWGVLGIMLLDAGFCLATGAWPAGLLCAALYGTSLLWPKARID